MNQLCNSSLNANTGQHGPTQKKVGFRPWVLVLGLEFTGGAIAARAGGRDRKMAERRSAPLQLSSSNCFLRSWLYLLLGCELLCEFLFYLLGFDSIMLRGTQQNIIRILARHSVRRIVQAEFDEKTG